jgi:membrane protein DedA with SNARE-associated domain
MLEDLLSYLEESEGPLAYLLLAAAAAVEYVFPPFPGDTITLFGIFLAATAGYHPVLVYAAATAGSIAGGLGGYAFGRFSEKRRDRWPKFLRGPRTERMIDEVQARFARHGAAYLCINRFVPALRSFFFVVAGLNGMKVWQVALYGGVSAAAWNAILFGIGYTVGRNWEELLGASRMYTIGTIALVAVVALAWWLRSRLRRRRGEPGRVD